MIKVGVSANRGQNWQISNLQNTTGGVLGFDVHPTDADLLYVGSVDTEALQIFKVTGAASRPTRTLLYEDRSVRHSPTRQATVHVGVSDEGEILVIYLNPGQSAYEVLVS